MSLPESGNSDSEVWDAAMLLISLADEAGGHVDTARLESRPTGSMSRRAYDLARKHIWINSSGQVTRLGYDALYAWREFDGV